MVAEKYIKLGSPNIKRIRIESLLPSIFQPRLNFKDETILELAQSIELHGMLQPLIVRENSSGKYEIIAGERRYRAAKIAQLKTLPCIVTTMLDAQALAVALVENLQREDLNPIEEANAYQRLRNVLKLNQEQVAQRVGKDRSSIANSLRLLRLPKLIQDMVVNSELSMGHARALLSLENPEMMALIALKAQREGLSVRRVESLIRSVKSGRLEELKREKGTIKTNKDPIEREIEQKLEQELGFRVELKKADTGYSMTMRFQSVEALNLLLERLAIEL